MSMTEHEWMNALSQDGFDHLTIHDVHPWEEVFARMYDRTHKIVVFTGELELAAGYEQFHLGEGDYQDIASATTYGLRAGAQGCRYVVAERV